MASRDTLAALRTCAGVLTAHVRAQAAHNAGLILETQDLMDHINDFENAVFEHTGCWIELPEMKRNREFVERPCPQARSELEKWFFAACDFMCKIDERLAAPGSADDNHVADDHVADEKDTIRELTKSRCEWRMAKSFLHYAVAAEMLLAKLDRDSNS